jgi:hypothetical protein
LRRAFIVLIVTIVAACTRQLPAERSAVVVDATAPAASVEPTDAASSASSPRAPLAGFPELIELRGDDGEKLGFVSVPLGATEPRPIFVALHGGSDRPERACPAWRTAVDAYAFVVCPHGWGGNEARLGWRGPADSKARITRAVASTKKVFGDWVKDTSSLVLAGFSMGATEVARIAESDPKIYRRIVIGDSAHDPRPPLLFSKAWAAGGGERAMFLCTTSGCEPSMRAAAKRVAAQKTTASARLVVAPVQKHLLNDRVARAMRRDWKWLVEGAEGWEGYVAPTEAIDARTESFDPE